MSSNCMCYWREIEQLFFYFLNSICKHYCENLSFYEFVRKKLTADGNYANTTHSFVMKVKREVLY